MWGVDQIFKENYYHKDIIFLLTFDLNTAIVDILDERNGFLLS